MIVFNECRRRRDNVCDISQAECRAGQEMDIEKCHRMCKENKKHLQCPTCKTSLFLDANCQANDLYCPKCDKDVNRNDAIQTIERLKEELDKENKELKKWEKINEVHLLTPGEYGSLERLRVIVPRIKEMISKFKKQEKSKET